MVTKDTEYANIPFFDYHTRGDSQCDACYTLPRKQSCGGRLHNHLESTMDEPTYVVLWRCDECGGSHQDENIN